MLQRSPAILKPHDDEVHDVPLPCLVGPRGQLGCQAESKGNSECEELVAEGANHDNSLFMF